MQNLANLQQFKEQVKLKSLELKKVKEDKDKSIKYLTELIANNRIEINNLKTVIKKKEKEEARERHRFPPIRLRNSYAPEKKSGNNESDEIIPVEKEIDTSFSNSMAVPFLKKKIKSLKDQAQFLKKQFDSEQKNKYKILKENRNFQKEVILLRAEITDSKLLIKKTESLQSQLKKEQDSTLSARLITEKVIEQKKSLIRKYEKYLYGEVAPGKKRFPPSIVIRNMKNEIETLEEEHRQLNQGMKLLQEENDELESKIIFLEEKEILEASEYKSEMDSRVANTTEFSSGLESFLITYSDLITLILVIFVLLYSLSTVDSEKFKEAFTSFQEQEFQHTTNNIRLSDEELKMLKRVRELVKDNADPESLVRSDVRTILIRLKSSDLFTPGEAELLPGVEDLIVNSIKKEMRDGVKQVHVDGHTDDVPMKANVKFPTNWELSSVRAAHVGRVIIDKFGLSPDRMVVTGYGQYRPIKPNNSDLNRAVNRRVEIKILKDIIVADENEDSKNLNNRPSEFGFGKKLTGPILLPTKSPPQNP